MYRYSKRLSWPVHPNAVAKNVNQRRQRNQPTLDLTCSNPTEALENYPHTAIAEALHAIESFRYEPDPAGNARARVAIQRYYADRGIEALPDNMLLTASTSEAYALLFKVFCDPGDEVLVPVPSYPLFEYLANLESVCITNYHLHFDGIWFIDFEHLRHQISPRTRAIVIVNPNNPTGSFLKQRELHTLFEIAAERKLPIISDEVFLDYEFHPNPERVHTLIGHNDVLSFSLSGLSKSAGMPQMKLGWILMNGPGQEVKIAYERLSLVADTYLSVGTPVQAASLRLFEIGAGIQKDIRGRIQSNWLLLNRLLKESPVTPLTCEGGWSAIVRLPATHDEERWWLRILEECEMLVQPGYFFDMASEPYMVVSLLSAPADFEEGISRLHQLATHS